MVVKYEIRLTGEQLVQNCQKVARKTSMNITIRKRSEILIDVDKNHGKAWSQSFEATRNKNH